MDELEKVKKTKSALSRYRKIFKNIDPSLKHIVEKLYGEAVFMEVTLADLQEKIQKDGAVIETRNGNGFMVLQEHPAQKSYNAMIRNYNGVMNKLVTYIPEDAEDDALTEWLKK